jgi:hypothetical protein
VPISTSTKPSVRLPRKRRSPGWRSTAASTSDSRSATHDATSRNAPSVRGELPQQADDFSNLLHVVRYSASIAGHALDEVQDTAEGHGRNALRGTVPSLCLCSERRARSSNHPVPRHGHAHGAVLWRRDAHQRIVDA